MDVPPVTPKVKGKLGGNVALQNKVSKFLQNNLESDKVSIDIDSHFTKLFDM